jgi:hypothetical protein
MCVCDAPLRSEAQQHSNSGGGVWRSWSSGVEAAVV